MKKVFIVALVAVLSVVSFNAQAVGHINVAEVVQSLPKTKSAQDQLQSKADAKKADIDKAAQAFQAKAEAFQKKLEGMTQAQIDAQAQTLQTEQQGLQQEAQKIEELRNKAYEDIAKQENDLLAPIQDKVYKAIETVSTEKGLQYVLDVSASNVVVIARGTDITNDVKKKLGVNQ